MPAIQKSAEVKTVEVSCASCGARVFTTDSRYIGSDSVWGCQSCQPAEYEWRQTPVTAGPAFGWTATEKGCEGHHDELDAWLERYSRRSTSR